MSQCIFRTKKHSELDTNNALKVVPEERCSKKAVREKLFCAEHQKESEKYEPSAKMMMLLKAVKDKRGIK